MVDVLSEEAMRALPATLLLLLACGPKPRGADPAVVLADQQQVEAVLAARKQCARDPTPACATDWAARALEAMEGGAWGRGALPAAELEALQRALAQLNTPEALVDAARVYQALGRPTEAAAAAQASLMGRRSVEALALFVAVEPRAELRRAECKATVRGLGSTEERVAALTACARAGDDLSWALPEERRQARERLAAERAAAAAPVVRLTLYSACEEPVRVHLGPSPQSVGGALELAPGSTRSYTVRAGDTVWLLGPGGQTLASAALGTEALRLEVGEGCDSLSVRALPGGTN